MVIPIEKSDLFRSDFYCSQAVHTDDAGMKILYGEFLVHIFYLEVEHVEA